jgi:hypothetical protein
MNTGNLYTNRKGRYALLIYSELAKYPELKEQANIPYNSTICRLKEDRKMSPRQTPAFKAVPAPG